MSISSDDTTVHDNLGRFSSDSGNELIVSAAGLLLTNRKENIVSVTSVLVTGNSEAGMSQHPGLRREPMSLSSLFPLQSPAKNGRSDLYSISEDDKVNESKNDRTIESKNYTEEDKKGEKEVESAKVKAPAVRKEVTMSYKINCVSDISAILGTVEVDLKVCNLSCSRA